MRGVAARVAIPAVYDRSVNWISRVHSCYVDCCYSCFPEWTDCQRLVMWAWTASISWCGFGPLEVRGRFRRGWWVYNKRFYVFYSGHDFLPFLTFLADRTIGRAFVTGCRLSVCLSVVCDVLYPGKTTGPICMKFSGKVWSDHGTTWFNFGSIWRNRAMPRY